MDLGEDVRRLEGPTAESSPARAPPKDLGGSPADA
jgi:hypothetical protein